MKKIILLLVLLAAAGCSRKAGEVGKAGEIPEVKLASLLADPGAYNGRQVLLKGNVESVCPSGCDMVYREGPDSVTLFPRGFKIPKMKKGKPVDAYVDIVVGKKNTVYTLLRIEERK